jgi:diaminopimelate decarboxylase
MSMASHSTSKRSLQSVPPSSDFVYRGGILYAESVSLMEIADQVETPTYVYSASVIDGAYRRIDEALGDVPHLVAYSVKANGNLALLERLGRMGSGADIVSGGELARALEAGIPAERIVFSGVGKTDRELHAALDAGIYQINVESEPEIDALEAIARARGRRARVALRVNPDIDPQTHPYISTGLRTSKFGLEIDVARKLVPRLLESRHLVLQGVACHIGSQLLSPAPISDAVAIVAGFAVECVRSGAELRTLDAGGGWPILYGDEPPGEPFPFNTFGDAVREGIRKGGAEELGLQIIVEPGRFIMGDAGVLLTRVTYVKQQCGKRFIIVDGAMTDLVRPALYNSYHAVSPVRKPDEYAEQSAADVVGPVCETSDFLALDRELPEIRRGDLLAVRGAGAYGAVMASTYNARPRAAEVLVEGRSFRLIRARETIPELWQNEIR